MADDGTNRRRPTFTLRMRRAEISEYRADRPIPRARAASAMLNRRSGSFSLGRAASTAISSRKASTSSMTAARSRSLIRSGSFVDQASGMTVRLSIRSGLLDDLRQPPRSRPGEGLSVCNSFMAMRDPETSGLQRRRAFPGYRSPPQNGGSPNGPARGHFPGYSPPRPAQPDSAPIRRSRSSVG